jgi:long-chain acyl-CoA synthetase
VILSDITKRNARRYPDKTAMVYGTNRISFLKLWDRIQRLATAFTEHGFSKGDRVAVLLDNCPQYVELYFAVSHFGGILVPLNSFLNDSDIKSIIQDAEAKALVCGDRFSRLAEQIRQDCVSLSISINVGQESRDDTIEYESFINDDSGNISPSCTEQDVACIFFTSGTTGNPKGVMLSHRAMVECALNCMLVCHVRHHDVGLVLAPLFGVFGFLGIILTAFYQGATAIIITDITAPNVLETIEREGITYTQLSLPLIMDAVEHCRESKNDTSSLKCILVGGQTIPTKIYQAAIKFFGNIFYQMYALSEAGAATCLLPADQVADGEVVVERLLSCGREVPNIEVRIVNDDGDDVPPNTVGELLVKGDSLMNGYWKMPEMTREVLREGYVHTSDLASYDAAGFIYLAGRKKDLIMRGEKRIYAVEVEEVISRHPDVIEIAVKGVPSEGQDELIKAFLVLRQGVPQKTEILLAYCKKHLPPFACPDSIEYVESLPRNATGKVLKRLL